MAADAGTRSLAEDCEGDHCSGSNASTVLHTAITQGPQVTSPRGPRAPLQRSVACQQALEPGVGGRGGADDLDGAGAKEGATRDGSVPPTAGNSSHHLQGRRVSASSNHGPPVEAGDAIDAADVSSHQQQQHHLVEMAAHLLAHGAAGADASNLDDLLKRLRSALLRSRPKRSPSSDALAAQATATATTGAAPASSSTGLDATTSTGADVTDGSAITATTATATAAQHAMDPAAAAAAHAFVETAIALEGSGDGPAPQEAPARAARDHARGPDLLAAASATMASIAPPPAIACASVAGVGPPFSALRAFLAGSNGSKSSGGVAAVPRRGSMTASDGSQGTAATAAASLSTNRAASSASADSWSAGSGGSKGGLKKRDLLAGLLGGAGPAMGVTTSCSTCCAGDARGVAPMDVSMAAEVAPPARRPTGSFHTLLGASSGGTLSGAGGAVGALMGKLPMERARPHVDCAAASAASLASIPGLQSSAVGDHAGVGGHTMSPGGGISSPHLQHQQLLHALAAAGAGGLADRQPFVADAAGALIGGRTAGDNVQAAAPELAFSSAALGAPTSSSSPLLPFFGMSIGAGFGASSSSSPALNSSSIQKALALASPTKADLGGSALQNLNAFLAAFGGGSARGGNALAPAGGGYPRPDAGSVNNARSIAQHAMGASFAPPGHSSSIASVGSMGGMAGPMAPSMGNGAGAADAGNNGGINGVTGNNSGGITPFEAFIRMQSNAALLAHAKANASAETGMSRAAQRASPSSASLFANANACGPAQPLAPADAFASAASLAGSASTLESASLMDLGPVSLATSMGRGGSHGIPLPMGAAASHSAAHGGGSSKDSHSAPLVGGEALQRLSSDARSLARTDQDPGQVARFVAGGSLHHQHRKRAAAAEMVGRSLKRAVGGAAMLSQLEDAHAGGVLGVPSGGNGELWSHGAKGVSPMMAAVFGGGEVTNGVLASLQLPPSMLPPPQQQQQPMHQQQQQPMHQQQQQQMHGLQSSHSTLMAGIQSSPLQAPCRPALKVSIPQVASANGSTHGGVPAPLTPVHTPSHTPTNSFHSNSRTSDSSSGERPGQGPGNAWASSPLGDGMTSGVTELDSAGIGGSAPNAAGVVGAVDDSAARLRREKRKNQRAVAKGKAAPASGTASGAPASNADASADAKRITKLESENRSLNMRLAFVNRLNSEQTLRIEELEAELADKAKLLREMRARLGEVEPEAI